AAVDRYRDTVDGVFGSLRFIPQPQPAPTPEPGMLQLSVLTKSGETPHYDVEASVYDLQGTIQGQDSSLAPDQVFTLSPGLYDVEIDYETLADFPPITARVSVTSSQAITQQLELPFDEERLHVVLQKDQGEAVPETTTLRVTSLGWDRPITSEGSEHTFWLPTGLTYTLTATYEGLGLDPVRATREVVLQKGEPQSVTVALPIVESELRILLRTEEGQVLDQAATVQITALDEAGDEVTLVEEVSREEVSAILLAGVYNVNVKYLSRVERLEGIRLRAEPLERRITFPAPSTLYVVLRREDGRILDQEAGIRVTTADEEVEEEETLASGRTTDEFSAQLLPGTYNVIVEYFDREQRADNTQLGSQPKEITVTFPLPGTLIVQLRTPAGRVLQEDARVAIYPEGGQEPISEAFTNDEHMVSLLPGTYAIEATYDLGYTTDRRVEWPGLCPCPDWVHEYVVTGDSALEFRTSDSTVGDVDLTLEGWTGTSWRQVDSSTGGTARESIVLEEPAYRRYRVTVVNFSDEPGEVLLSTRTVRTRKQVETVSLQAGRTLTKTLHFPEIGALVLQFETQSGEPTKRGVDVTIRELPLGKEIAQGRVDEEGGFSIPAWAGSYEVTYQYDLTGIRATTLEAPIQVQPGEPTEKIITLPFSEGELSVIVRSKTGEEPPENASITIFDTTGRRVSEVEANDQSVWLPAGAYQIVVTYGDTVLFDEVRDVQPNITTTVEMEIPNQ
ncbi:MAG: hypothetical protein ACE5I2_13545, partial [Anaerolineae bacterium]